MPNARAASEVKSSTALESKRVHVDPGLGRGFLLQLS